MPINEFSPTHPHEPEIPPAIADDGHCRVCRLIVERDKLQAFKGWVHNYLDTHGVPHHPPGTHGAEGCRIGDRMDWLMERVTGIAEPIPANEERAATFRAAQLVTEDGKPDGTRESLERCAEMLDTYGPDCFPANEQGQIHFARAMMEGTADEIRAFLARDHGPEKL